MNNPKSVESKKCLVCGNLFSKRNTESKKYWMTKKYCSQQCSLELTNIRKQKDNGGYKKGHIPWSKEGLKGRSVSPKTQFRKGHPSNLGRKFPHLSGKNHFAWKPKITKICEICKSEMILPPWDAKRRRFCGRKCRAIGTRGKGSPVYKGENATTPFRIRVMELPEYKEWHAAVLKRDNYLCVICKSRNKLEVDHIKRFLHIANENNLITIEDARNCKELWDISNGRTLCQEDHRKTSTYGTTGLGKNISK